MGYINFTDKVEYLESENRYRILDPDKIILDCAFSRDSIVLDLGCGTGFFTVAISRFLDYNGKVYAFDIDNGMIMSLRKRIEKPNIVPILISGQSSLPLKDKYVDFVIMSFLLGEPGVSMFIFTEVKRILKKNARICIIDWKDDVTGGSGFQKPFINYFALCEYLGEHSFDIVLQKDLNSFHYVLVADLI